MSKSSGQQPNKHPLTTTNSVTNRYVILQNVIEINRTSYVVLNHRRSYTGFLIITFLTPNEVLNPPVTLAKSNNNRPNGVRSNYHL